MPDRSLHSVRRWRIDDCAPESIGVTIHRPRRQIYLVFAIVVTPLYFS